MKNIQRKIISLVLLCTIAFSSTISTVINAEEAEQYYYSEGFETVESAEAAGFIIDGKGETSIIDVSEIEGVVNSLGDGDKKALHMSNPGREPKRHSVYYDLGRAVTTGVVTVEITAMFTTTTMQQLGIQSSNGQSVVALMNEEETGIFRLNTNKHLDSKSELYKWCVYKFVIDLDDRSIDIYRDDERLATRSDYFEATAPDFGRIRFNMLQTTYWYTQSDLYVSDIKVSVAGGLSQEKEQKEIPDDYKASVGLLKALNIMDDNEYPDMNRKITRAEFAKLAVRTRGVTDSDLVAEDYEESVFSDVSSAHQLKRYIMYLYQTGIVSGYGDGSFRPEAELSGTDGLKILLDLMGYKEYVLAKGGYPAGYTIIGTQLKLSRNIGMTNNLTYGDAVTMIFNALHAKFPTLDYATEEELIYNVTTDNTLLSEIFGYSMDTGIMNASQYSGLSYKKSDSEINVEIDRVKYYTDNVEYANYLGYNVTYYYDKESNDLFYAYPDESNDVLTIGADSLPVVSENGTEFKMNYEDENGKQKKLTVSPLASGIRNGASLERALTKDDLEINSGTLTFVDNDSDSEYDVVLIKSYESYVIDAVDVENTCLYGKVSNNCVHFAEDYIIYQDGEQISIDALKEGAVISVLQTLGSNGLPLRTEAYVLTDTVTGTIQSTRDDYYEIGGKEYRLSPDYVVIESPIVIGETVTLLLDVEGKILAKDDNLSVAKEITGYLIAASPGTGLNDNTKFKILSENGQIYVLDSADKIYLNDNLSSDSTSLIADLKTTGRADSNDATQNTVMQPIKYTLNSQGEVRTLNTDYYVAFNELKTRYHRRPIRGFEDNPWEMFYTLKTKVFVISEDDVDESAVVKGSELQDDKKYTCQAFNKNDMGTAELIVVIGDAGAYSIEGDTPQLVVDKKTIVLNDNEEAVYKIDGYYRGVYDSFYTEDLTGVGSNLAKGDIVRMTHTENVIKAITEDFILNSNPAFFTNSSPGGNAYMVYGRLVGVKDGFFTLQTEIGSDKTFYPFEGKSSTRYFLIDQGNPRVDIKKISYNDIKLYTYEKNPDAKVFVRSSNGSPQDVLVILPN